MISLRILGYTCFKTMEKYINRSMYKKYIFRLKSNQPSSIYTAK